MQLDKSSKKENINKIPKINQAKGYVMSVSLIRSACILYQKFICLWYTSNENNNLSTDFDLLSSSQNKATNILGNLRLIHCSCGWMGLEVGGG